MMPAASGLVPRLAVMTILAGSLCGCKFAGDLLAAGAGGASAAATANPAVGIAVGISVQATTNAVIKYVMRKRQQAEQDAIAETVGTMEVGQSRAWKIRHVIPIGNEHGTVEVVGLIPNPLSVCKEAVFSVIDGHHQDSPSAWYVMTACRQRKRWKWAVAEPAVERWGSLQ
ncbi:MAG: hypothetical protein ACREFU_21185 [Acetobacteraceae bacterium]